MSPPPARVANGLGIGPSDAGRAPVIDFSGLDAVDEPDELLEVLLAVLRVVPPRLAEALLWLALLPCTDPDGCDLAMAKGLELDDGASALRSGVSGLDGEVPPEDEPEADELEVDEALSMLVIGTSGLDGELATLVMLASGLGAELTALVMDVSGLGAELAALVMDVSGLGAEPAALAMGASGLGAELTALAIGASGLPLEEVLAEPVRLLLNALVIGASGLDDGLLAAVVSAFCKLLAVLLSAAWLRLTVNVPLLWLITPFC